MGLLDRSVVCVAFFVGALAAVGSIGGCGGDVQVGSGGAAAAGGTAGHGGAVTTSAGGFAGSTVTGGQGGDFTMTTGAGGCNGTGQCPEGTYCNDFTNGCFQGGAMGTCDPVTLCNPSGLVCGCDGSIYESDCAAFKAGVDLSLSGCEAPADTFVCGALYCKSHAETCVHYVGFAMYDACEKYPPACDPAQQMLTCKCLAPTCMCMQDGDGDFTETCNTID